MQTLAGADGHGRISPKRVFTDHERSLVQDRCFLGLALHLLQACKIMQHFRRLYTLRAELLLANTQRAPVEQLRLPLLPLSGGEKRQSMQRSRHIGMLWSELLLADT